MCCAGSRLLLQESIAEEFLDAAWMELLHVGDFDKNTDIGAVNSQEQLDRIVELCAAGADEGAEVIQSSCAMPKQGLVLPADDPHQRQHHHRVATEEIFGPVLAVMTFRTPDEAVAKANATPYGLAAGVWTENGARILWMSQRLAPASCGPTPPPVRSTSPFGGMRESGFGREGGRYGLEAYSRPVPDDRPTPRRDRRRDMTELGSTQSVQALQRRSVRPVRVGAGVPRRRRSAQAGWAARRPPTCGGRSSTASPRCSTPTASSSWPN